MRMMLTVVVLGLFALGAQGDEKAYEVVKKAITAHGGEEKIMKDNAEYYEYTGTLKLKEAPRPLRFTSVTTFQYPNKEHSVLKMRNMGMEIKLVQIANGKSMKLFIDEKEESLSDKVKEDMYQSVLSQNVTRLVPIIKDKMEAKIVKEKVSVKGSDAIAIAVKTKEIREITLYFDLKSNLLVKVDSMGLDSAEEKDMKIETFLMEYKELDGVKYASKIETLHDGEEFMKAEIKNRKTMKEADKKLFDTSD